MNKSIYYDSAMVKEMSANLYRFFKMPYRSIWRVLHIDGFEPNFHPLPARTGHKIEFFHYTSMSAEQQAEKQRQINADLDALIDRQFPRPESL